MEGAETGLSSDASVEPAGVEHAAPAAAVTTVSAPSRGQRWLPIAVVAGGVVLACGLLVAAWSYEQVRSALAWVAPGMVPLAYGLVGCGLLMLAGRRFLPVGGAGTRAPRSLPRWLQGGVAGAMAMVAAVLAALVQLVAVWEEGKGAVGMVGGIIPFADGDFYFGGAERLLLFGQLDAFNSQRPIASMFDAVWLALAGLDLRLALVLQAALVGISCYLGARAVAKDLGPIAGLAFFVAVFAFAHPWSATTMTEAPGILLGILGFAALWNAVRTRSSVMVVGGIFLVTLALVARAGPLPLALVLCFWFGRHLRLSARLNWRLLAMSVGSVVLAFGLAYGAVATFHGRVDNVNGHWGYLAYGLATGHPNWERDSSKTPSWVVVLEDHPELNRMPYVERNHAINRLAQQEVRAQPVRTVITLLRSGRNYLAQVKDKVFAPVPAKQRRAAWVASGFLVGAFLVRRWRRSGSRAVLDGALFGGMAISVAALLGYEGSTWFGAVLVALAFVAFLVIGTDRLACRAHLSFTVAALAALVGSIPIIGIDGARLFAPAIGFLALPLALAVAAIVAELSAHDALPRLEPHRSNTSSWLPLAVGGGLVAVLLVGTPLAMAIVDKPRVPARACPDGRRAEPLFGGVKVHLVDSGAASQSGIDRLPLASARQGEAFDLIPAFNQVVTGPMTLVVGVTATGADRFAFLRGEVGQVGDVPLQLCGETVRDASSEALYAYLPHPFDFFVGTVARSEKL